MHKINLLLFIVLLMMTLTSFSQVEDVDGNKYKTAQIGDQIWMTENLRTSRYQNGQNLTKTPIIEGYASLDNIIEKKGAWISFEGNTLLEPDHGKLYNRYAVIDKRGICPKGWHVPSRSEWEKMFSFVGGIEVAAYKLKSKNAWKSNGNGIDAYGFNVLPSGILFGDWVAGDMMTFSGFNEYVWFWSSSSYRNKYGLEVSPFILFNEDGDVYVRPEESEVGYFCIRCVKD